MTARPVGVAGDRVLRTVPCKPDTQTNGPVGAHSGMPTPPVGPTVGLPPAVVALVLGAARGMAAVAAAGIVHRDLLRHNVLVATGSGGGGGGSGGGAGLGLGLGSSAGVGCGAEKMASWSAGRAVIADFGLACWLAEPYPGQGTPRAR